MENKEKAVVVLNHAGYPRGVAGRLNDQEISDLAGVYDKSGEPFVCLKPGLFDPIWEGHLKRMADGKAVVDEEPVEP